MHPGLAADNLTLTSVSAKVLIADDSRLQRKLLQQILQEAGYKTILACDGVEAVELFRQEQPDLVLLDIKMPNMEGIEAARKIQKAAEFRYIPIIFVTQADSRRYLQECIEVEGDDFIAKPVDPVKLTAKIRSILRVKNLYQQQYDNRQNLLGYQQQIEREQEIAASLYETIIKSGFVDSPNLQLLHSAMSFFNGDVLLSAFTPLGQHYVLLGDFTGHGLSASIGVGPTAEVFYGMTDKGFGIQEIVAEINRKLFRLLPVELFFGACLVSLDPHSNTLSVFTGGLPDHYLHNSKTGVVRTIPSSNLPLGIVNSGQLNPKLDRYDVDGDDKLYFFTDGVIETENRNGDQFGQAAVLECIESLRVAGRTGFESIRQTLTEFRGDLAQQDDVTLAELSCDSRLLRTEPQCSSYVGSKIVATRWKISMEFHATTLKEVDPVPVIVHALMEIQELKAHRESIFMIVSELFSNALEYGLLGLDGKLKSRPDGIIKYLEMREQGLQGLTEGAIKVTVSHKPIDGGGRMTIRMQDSGAGFNFQDSLESLNGQQSDAKLGLGLLKKLCRSIEFLHNGSHVKAIYDWTTE